MCLGRGILLTHHFPKSAYSILNLVPLRNCNKSKWHSFVKCHPTAWTPALYKQIRNTPHSNLTIEQNYLIAFIEFLWRMVLPMATRWWSTVSERCAKTQGEMMGPASNTALGTDPVQLVRTSTGEDKFPVGVQLTIQGGSQEGRIAQIHSEDLCLSYPKVLIQSWDMERTGWLERWSYHHHVSHYLKSGWSRFRNPLLSAQDTMPTSLINHGMLYSVHSKSSSVCFFWVHFPKTIIS